MSLPTHPFEHDRAIGTLISVSGSIARANLPNAAMPGSRWHYGSHMDSGRVGEFVVVETLGYALIGRLVEVRLPERERLSVEEQFQDGTEVHPIGTIQLMCSICLLKHRVEAGIPVSPKIGSRCFSASPLLIEWVMASGNDVQNSQHSIELGCLAGEASSRVLLRLESLFARHCAILGTTGAGKSYTLARLMQEVAKLNCRILVLDATGEFCSFQEDYVLHCHLGRSSNPRPERSCEVRISHSSLDDLDFMALFQPSVQSQSVKLRSALQSLRLSKQNPTELGGGAVLKANQDRRQFEELLAKADARVNRSGDFAFSDLARQVENECIYQSHRTDSTKWGDVNQSEQGYCASLVARIQMLLRAAELKVIFGEPVVKNFFSTLAEFVKPESSHRVLRLSLEHVTFDFGLRELVVNTIGRVLLSMARKGAFENLPIVVFVDEAHQFFTKTVGPGESPYKLDSFEVIAKEGRKYSLCVCLATQRPRDLGQAVLSQVGTMIVHRLINPEDREVVDKASSDLAKGVSNLIPMLSQGQALVLGTDYPLPVTIDIAPPLYRPSNSGADFAKHWKCSDLEESHAS